MSESITNLKVLSVDKRGTSVRSLAPAGLEIGRNALVLFVLVAGAELAFGMWMNARGFIYNDAYSRAASALLSMYSADPHLAIIGFVWMPLPSLIELVWVAAYPVWPSVVSSGFASTFTTALAGGATAMLLLATSRRLGISTKLGWAYSLLVAANPMLFLYGSNGESEGVAAPFLIAAVCSLVLFWHSDQKRFVSLAGVALALGFASCYEAAAYGAALCAVLVLWAVRQAHALQGNQTFTFHRQRFALHRAEGLGILLVAPSLYVAVVWVGANALIMKNPFYFATAEYSNYGQTLAVGGGGLARQAVGDMIETVEYVFERALPFLIPGLGLAVVRALDKRFWSLNTFFLALLLLSVPFGLIAPLVYLGSSFGWLRFFMYPLFVAAAWGLYELAHSRHRRAAAAIVLASWIVAIPCIFSAMVTPALGQEEHGEVQSLLTGETATQTSFGAWQPEVQPVARYLESDIFPKGQVVAVDPYQGFAVAAQTQPEHLRRFVVLVLNGDGRFGRMLRDPSRYHITYFLVPNPAKAPLDVIARAYPGLWIGNEAGFVLVKSFPNTPQEWRLYKVGPLLRTAAGRLEAASHLSMTGELPPLRTCRPVQPVIRQGL